MGHVSCLSRGGFFFINNAQSLPFFNDIRVKQKNIEMTRNSDRLNEK